MPLAIFSDSTAWFVSDMVGNPEDRFSHNEAHIRATILLSASSLPSFIIVLRKPVFRVSEQVIKTQTETETNLHVPYRYQNMWYRCASSSASLLMALLRLKTGFLILKYQ